MEVVVPTLRVAAPSPKSKRPCQHCAAELPLDSPARRKFCCDRCRYAHRDERRAADPEYRERWRESSRRRYASLTPEERAARIAQVKAATARREASRRP